MPNITVNAEPKTLPDPLTVAGLLRHLGKDPAKLAVEVNRDVVPRIDHPTRRLADGDAVEIVTLVGGGRPRSTRRWTGLSRWEVHRKSPLFTGTGKYSSYELMQRCADASGCGSHHVAVSRRLIDKDGKSLLDFLDLSDSPFFRTRPVASAPDAIATLAELL